MSASPFCLYVVARTFLSAGTKPASGRQNDNQAEAHSGQSAMLVK